MLFKEYKNIVRKATIVSCLISCIGCSDDFIDLAPISDLNAVNFYQSQEDFETAVFGAYDVLQSPGQYGDGGNLISNFKVLMEIRGDDATGGQDRGNSSQVVQLIIDNFEEVTTNSTLAQSWTSLYDGINRCNIILDKIGEASFDETLKNQLEGEARFIRALSYFNLVRLWGDVPLVLSQVSAEEARNGTRTPVTQVYSDGIIPDLEFAISNLPDTYIDAEFGRATSDAARTLLADVNLTLGNHNEVVNLLSTVIQSSRYSLVPVDEIFSNETNSEIIFSVRFSAGGIGEGTLNGTPNLAFANLEPLYSPVDLRIPFLNNAKLTTGISPTGDIDQDFILYRYAEVLLMLAESLNELGYNATGDAFTVLNDVRERAGIPTLSSTDLPDQSSFRNAVILERRLELVAENKRWFDQVRLGTAVQDFADIGVTISTNRNLYPIPQREIDIYNNPSNFPQNPGY